MFNIEEGTAKHKEEVFQRRIKMLQRAYRDGFFNETGTTPMPEITADGERPTDEVSPYTAVLTQAEWAKQQDEEERRLREDSMSNRSGYEYPEAYCKRCCRWWMTKAYGLYCPECGGRPDPDAV